MQEDMPLEQRRGISSYDSTQRLILVKSSADGFVQAIADSWQVLMLEANAYGTPIEFNDNSCIVYRLRGHSWTVLDLLGYKSSFNERDFTCSISKNIGGEALLFEQSDVSIFIQYDLFDNGYFVESINFHEAAGIEDGTAGQSFEVENNHYILKFRYLSSEKEEDYGSRIPFEVNCCFESRLRQPSVAEIGHPHEFIENFLEEKDVYIPDIVWIPPGVKRGEMHTLSLEGISSFDFEECYYLNFV